MPATAMTRQCDSTQPTSPERGNAEHIAELNAQIRQAMVPSVSARGSHASSSIQGAPHESTWKGNGNCSPLIAPRGSCADRPSNTSTAAGTTWVPDPGVYSVFCRVLAKVSDPTMQWEAAAEELSRLSSPSDFTRYLAYAFAHPQGDARQEVPMIGVLLKSRIEQDCDTTIPMADLSLIRDTAFSLWSAPTSTMRTTGILVLTALFQSSSFNMAQGMPFLLLALNSRSPAERECAFALAARLAKYVPEQLQNLVVFGVKPIDALVPGWIQAAAYANPAIRFHALTGLVCMAEASTSVLLDQYFDLFFSTLCSLTAYPHPHIRRLVCRAFDAVVITHLDKVAPSFDCVAEFLLRAARDKDMALAMQACEAWSKFVDADNMMDLLRPWLRKLVRVLLEGMVYTEKDLFLLDDLESGPDCADPRRPLPWHHDFGSHPDMCELDERAVDGAVTKLLQDDPKTSKVNGQAVDETKSDWRDQDYYKKLDFRDPRHPQGIIALEARTLRKCCSDTVKSLSFEFSGSLIKSLVPLLKKHFASSNWLEREVGILALGEIAEGSYYAILPHLSSLIPIVIEALHDQVFLVRCIACWTLGRYGEWYLKSERHKKTYFAPVYQGILGLTLDLFKCVRDAACNSLVALMDWAESSLGVWVDLTVSSLVRSFETYGNDNNKYVCDAIAVLAEKAGKELDRSQHASILLPPLIDRWSALHPQDVNYPILADCLSSLATDMGEGFAHYAPAIVQRCMTILSTVMRAYIAGVGDIPTTAGGPFPVIVFDLLSGIVQGLQSNARSLLPIMTPSLYPLLVLYWRLPDTNVRQSAFVLLGDTAICNFEEVRPSLPYILPDLLACIEEDPATDDARLCNNAIWALGEIVMRLGPDPVLYPISSELVGRLMRVLLHPKSPQSLLENAAVAMGRSGLAIPAALAPQLDTFAEKWCMAMWDFQDNDEKDSAFRGFCHIVQLNPMGLAKAFALFSMAATRWVTPTQELHHLLLRTLTNACDLLGPKAWKVQKTLLPPLVTRRLESRYGL